MRIIAPRAWLGPVALLLALTACDEGPSSIEEPAREKGQVRVKAILPGVDGYDTFEFTQPVVRLQRKGQRAKIVPDGDAVFLKHRQPLGRALNALPAGVSLEDRTEAPKRYLKFSARAVLNGQTLDLYAVDSRRGRNFKDPERLLLFLNGRLSRSIQINYATRGANAQIRGFYITDLDESGSLRRMTKIEFIGLTLGCSAKRDSSPIRRAVAVVAEYLLPSALEAQDTRPCIDDSLLGLAKDVGLELVAGILPGEDVFEAHGIIATTEQIMCLIAIWTLPVVPKLTISCPQCPLDWVWYSVWDPVTQEWADQWRYERVCPADDSDCTATTP